LLVVGLVSRNRISRFKRTSSYQPRDWDALSAIWESIPHRYSIAHILAEASALTDLKGPEGTIAREILRKAITLMEEIPINSRDACASSYYHRLGLTDAAIGLAARRRGCSVITNDSDLYRALLEEGASAIYFDELRTIL
jgi:predicted nucleic acid-binding protein